MIVRRISWVLLVIMMFYRFGVATDSRHTKTIKDIGRQIENLKKAFPQLKEFSRNNIDVDHLKISYGYHTHKATHIGGWTAGVPNPDADGIWFYIDFHDAGSTAQIHTQPASLPVCFGDLRVSFLILEGSETKSVQAAIGKILERHGVKRCRD